MFDSGNIKSHIDLVLGKVLRIELKMIKLNYIDYLYDPSMIYRIIIDRIWFDDMKFFLNKISIKMN